MNYLYVFNVSWLNARLDIFRFPSASSARAYSLFKTLFRTHGFGVGETIRMRLPQESKTWGETGLGPFG